jgi:hypothetical protein
MVNALHLPEPKGTTMSVAQLGPIELYSSQSASHAVRFPKAAIGTDQDAEWCEFYTPDGWQRLRLHDYADIYRVPGLYEHIFANLLECTSPQEVIGLLGTVLKDWPDSPTAMRVIDLGAGNGMVGEQLRALGVRELAGVDLIPQAAEAAHRDRPGMYDEYVVGDMTQPSETDLRVLKSIEPNCLATCSALGFGDIPPAAFANIFNLVSTPGWIAFNIKERFLSGKDDTGFCRLIRAMTDQGIIQIQSYRRYQHRLSVTGQKLHYVAMVARKMGSIHESMVTAAEQASGDA